MVQIKYASKPAAAPESRFVRALRTFILIGVWTLVGLAGVAAWVHLTA